MKVCFTGGGTGGHVFPVFAIDEQLGRLLERQGEPYERFWLGSRMPLENHWVLSASIPHIAIRSGKLRRYFSWRFIPDMMGIVVGFFQSLYFLSKEKPDVLFSKGGYVSVPPVLAAKILGIPSLTHESDAIVGLATRINAHFVETVCIPFEEVKTQFPAKMHHKLVATGVPSRLSAADADAKRAFERYGIPMGCPLIVVLGGSQGALQINEMVWEQLDRLLEIGSVVHQSGEKTYRNIRREGYHIIPFIEDGLGDLLAAATVVISRSGATALADFLEFCVPMVLIPLGMNASRGEQMGNAQRIVSAGAAILMEAEEATGDNLVSLVENIVYDHDIRESMVKGAKSLRPQPAAPVIASRIVRCMTGKEKRSHK